MIFNNCYWQQCTFITIIFKANLIVSLLLLIWEKYWLRYSNYTICTIKVIMCQLNELKKHILQLDVSTDKVLNLHLSSKIKKLWLWHWPWKQQKIWKYGLSIRRNKIDILLITLIFGISYVNSTLLRSTFFFLLHIHIKLQVPIQRNFLVWNVIGKQFS